MYREIGGSERGTRPERPPHSPEAAYARDDHLAFRPLWIRGWGNVQGARHYTSKVRPRTLLDADQPLEIVFRSVQLGDRS
ncbi:hypothetical protein PISMIDRAFT_684478, partial [Pisolithus microcarpus 441]